MRIFVNELDSSFGKAFIKNLQQHGHEVVGTVYQSKNIQPTISIIKSGAEELNSSEDIIPIVLNTNEEEKIRLLRSSHVIVYSLLRHPNDTLEALKSLDGELEEEKYFIGLSSILTWSRTPVPKTNGFLGFKEEEYKSRKTGTTMAETKALETQILSAQRNNLKTLIIASGLLYGGMENDFQYLFRNAWLLDQNALAVPCIGKTTGNNYLPMISIYDLSTFVSYLINTPPSKNQYVVAVDQANITLSELTQVISKALGNGKVRELTLEEKNQLALEENNLSCLQVDLRFDMNESILSNIDLETFMSLKDGLIGHIDMYVKDYITCMDLRPIRAILLGPPQVGKTMTSQIISKQYYLPLINLKNIMNELFYISKINDESKTNELSKKMKEIIPQLKGYDEDNKIDQMSIELKEQIYKWKLSQPICRNQGYIMDGYPETQEEAKNIFKAISKEIDENEQENEKEEEDEEEMNENGSENMGGYLPTHVIILDAHDDILEQRARELTQEDAKKSKNTQNEFQIKLNKFRTEMDISNTESIVCYFEQQVELEILELLINEEDDDNNKKKILNPSIQRYLESGGKPMNFHPNQKELKEMEINIERLKMKEEANQQDEEKSQILDEVYEKQLTQEKEKNRLKIIEKEQAELLEARSMPLRNYLMENVIPSLTEGMLQVVKVQPEDPIDFLAEFLFHKGQQIELQKQQRQD